MGYTLGMAAKQTAYIGLRITPELASKLKAQARGLGVKPAELARLAIAAHITDIESLERQRDIEDLISRLERKLVELDTIRKKLIADYAALRDQITRFVDGE